MVAQVVWSRRRRLTGHVPAAMHQSVGSVHEADAEAYASGSQTLLEFTDSQEMVGRVQRAHSIRWRPLQWGSREAEEFLTDEHAVIWTSCEDHPGRSGLLPR